MIEINNRQFSQVWFADFEYRAPPGERQHPNCMVARELRTKKYIRIWEDELFTLKEAPHPVDKNTLYVAYAAAAEMGCFKYLDWPMPANILDLYAEFRSLTNGLYLPEGTGLLGALQYFGLPSIDVAEKKEMRELSMRGGPWSEEEKKELLDYCQSDVDALVPLFEKMLPYISINRALIRGSYARTVAEIEYHGTPVDTESLHILYENWDGIQEKLIREIDKDFDVYDGCTFKQIKFARYLHERAIPWPTTVSGNLSLSQEAFRDMVKTYPELNPLKELRSAIGQMRQKGLAIGSDGRNRTSLRPFSSITGRNQPSSKEFIFGNATWNRSLIKPPYGHGVAYLDYSQQEWGIAAALSGDKKMKDAYESADPYISLAVQAGAAPAGATKESHPKERMQFKQLALAVQYGMGVASLAPRINDTTIKAQQLLNIHKQTYKRFWEWSEGNVDYAKLHGKFWTALGWILHDDGRKITSLRNFLMQANGAEILRLACGLILDSSVCICCPVHDAVLIEAPLDKLNEHILIAKNAMEQASEIILDGFRIKTDAYIVKYPERYSDERGEKMWGTVWDIINRKLGMPGT
jgi:hypothetical protein